MKTRGKPLDLDLYEKLRRIARAYFRKERPGQTVAPTGLVHEAYLRWASEGSANRKDGKDGPVSDAAALARLMREILINRARAKGRQKRGGNRIRITFNEEAMDNAKSGESVDLEFLDSALKELKQKDAKLATLIELRFFLGMTIPEAAKVLKISPATAKREWAFARAWLGNEIETKKKAG